MRLHFRSRGNKFGWFPNDLKWVNILLMSTKTQRRNSTCLGWLASPGDLAGVPQGAVWFRQTHKWQNSCYVWTSTPAPRRLTSYFYSLFFFFPSNVFLQVFTSKNVFQNSEKKKWVTQMADENNRRCNHVPWACQFMAWWKLRARRGMKGRRYAAPSAFRSLLVVALSHGCKYCRLNVNTDMYLCCVARPQQGQFRLNAILFYRFFYVAENQ